MGGSESAYANHGYRVVEIAPGSPAEKAGLEPMFDFIQYAPNSPDDPLFTEIIAQN